MKQHPRLHTCVQMFAHPNPHGEVGPISIGCCQLGQHQDSPITNLFHKHVLATLVELPNLTPNTGQMGLWGWGRVQSP